MAKEWIIHFEVIAINVIPHSFPLDMLRRDHCYPSNDDSISEIMESFDQFGSALDYKPKPIRLTCLSHGNRNWKPNERRWQSFGYRVIKIDPAYSV